MRAAAEQPSAFPAGYFTGETTSWETANAILSEVRHAAGRCVPPHVHNAAYFSLLLEGAYAERGDGFDLRYAPYTLVFHSAGTLHEDEMPGPCRVFAVALLRVHATHLCRTFRRFRARTISEALLGARVQHVCRQLVESDEPLSSIAVEAGFTDQSHMTRVFKRLTGDAPGAHRRRERTKLIPFKKAAPARVILGE